MMKDNSHIKEEENTITEENQNEATEECKENDAAAREAAQDSDSMHNTDENKEKAAEDMARLQKEVQQKDTEIAQLKELMMRRQADFDNYKKRTARQEDMNKRMLIKDIALDVISINDNLIRASEAAEQVPEGEDLEKAHKSYVEGVMMISKSIEDMLAKYGIEEIDAQDKHFDPNVHEALEISMSDDVNEDTVTKVFQKGFRLEDFILRSSKVCVTKPLPKDETQNQEKEVQEDMPKTDEAQQESTEDKHDQEGI